MDMYASEKKRIRILYGFTPSVPLWTRISQLLGQTDKYGIHDPISNLVGRQVLKHEGQHVEIGLQY
jgi:hypothetical protein